MTSVVAAIEGRGGGGQGVVMVSHVTCGGEAGLDESPEGIHNIPEDLRGVFLHVVADTE